MATKQPNNKYILLFLLLAGKFISVPRIPRRNMSELPFPSKVLVKISQPASIRVKFTCTSQGPKKEVEECNELLEYTYIFPSQEGTGCRTPLLGDSFDCCGLFQSHDERINNGQTWGWGRTQRSLRLHLPQTFRFLLARFAAESFVPAFSTTSKHETGDFGFRGITFSH